MKYDFDTIIPRRGTNSYKWDTPEEENVLPMWVADMDFRTAPAIVEALQKRIAHGIFGYTKVPKAYYDAVVRWFDDRHRWQIDPRWIIYTNGVVPAPKAKILLLCNPHNPVGRVWTPEELWRIGDICLHNGVFVVADEIHCELVYEGHDYTPFASLSERFRQNSVTCVSPSKAFNLAGLQIANIIAADEGVRRRIDRAININEVCDVNPFGVIATIAAYNEGGAWLDALRKYLWENYEYLCRFFEQRLPQYPVLPLEGTYLVWIDCRASSIGSDATTLRLQEGQKLMVNSGTLYGPGGEGFIRLNIACPRTLLADGLERIAHVLVQNF